MRRFLLAGLAIVLLLAPGQALVAQSSDAVHEGMQRVELPEAGLALEIPSDWDYGTSAIRKEMKLPAEFDEPSLATEILLMTSFARDGDHLVSCEVATYEHVPLTLQEHADWYERTLPAAPDDETYAQPLELPIGDAIRVDFQTDVLAQAWYLFERDGVRFHFLCRSDVAPDDGWLELAWFIEPLAVDVPDWRGAERTADALVVTDYWTQSWVVDPLSSDGPPKVMWAWCEMTVFLEHDDGSASEWSMCSLTDDAVDPPELQGEPPAEVLVVSGPECVMLSDYWWYGHERELMASEFELTVTPEGKVLARSEFPADPIIC